MYSHLWRSVLWVVLAVGPAAWAQQASSCADLMHFKAPRVEISKASPIAAGTTEPNPWGPGRSAPLPAYCRVEGVINRRTGVGGEEFGINFALALPDKWNGDFLMQGAGGGNGTVQPPLGLNAADDVGVSSLDMERPSFRVIEVLLGIQFWRGNASVSSAKQKDRGSGDVFWNGSS